MTRYRRPIGHSSNAPGCASVWKVLLQGGPKKTGPYLNVDNFAMISVERRVICEKFANLPVSSGQS